MNARTSTPASARQTTPPTRLVQLIADRLGEALFIYDVLPADLQKAAREVIPLVDDYPRRLSKGGGAGGQR